MYDDDAGYKHCDMCTAGVDCNDPPESCKALPENAADATPED